MGILRFYLAICVVFVHAGIPTWWTVHDGTEAVQIFFLISGFYMQMIYDKYPDKYSFWMSRLSRIYVPYFAVLVVALVTAVALCVFQGSSGYLPLLDPNSRSHNTTLGMALTTVTNFSVIGQDLTLFVSDAGDPRFPLYRYLLIPQAWSVALELYFYALVPYLAKRRTHVLWAILCLSILARILCYESFGLTRDPWIYRFFPFELALFTAGMLAYRHAVELKIKLDQGHLQYFVFCMGSLFLFFGLRKSVSFSNRFLEYHYATLMSYVAWFCLVPQLFQITKKQRLDRFIGEFSYPIYLTHLIAIPVVDSLYDGANSLLRGGLIVFLTIAISIGVMFGVIQPLDTWRQRFLQSRRALSN